MRVAIVLAAGRSRRFGLLDKRSARLGGRKLLDHALAAARRAPVARVLLVVDPGRPPVHAPGVTIVPARGARQGLGVSLRAGLIALRPREKQLFLFLADMPAIPAALPFRLARALGRSGAARPVHNGRPGHPVLLRRPPPADIGRLRGDRGLAPLLREVVLVPAGAGAVLDIDRRGDLAALRRPGARNDRRSRASRFC